MNADNKKSVRVRSKLKTGGMRMVFKTLQWILRIAIILLFVVTSPLIFLLSIIHADSFKEAGEITMEMIKTAIRTDD